MSILKINSRLPKFKIGKIQPALVLMVLISVAVLMSIAINFYQKQNTKLADLSESNTSLKSELEMTKSEFEKLKSEDQVVKNKNLEDEIKNINKTYQKSVSAYENLLDLKAKSKNTDSLDVLFADTLSLLSERNYASAEAKLNTLLAEIKKEEDKIASTFKIPENVPVVNTPPQSGYKRQQVQTDAGSFLVDIVSADIGSTKVIVDTASVSDCANDCPVLPLAEYISRNGAYAGINGTYFCPASYPTCVGKTNSFDLLVMNKNKTYFNSGNNVYSSNPAVIFADGYVRFVDAVSQWGRDTSPNGVLSNFPLLVFNSNVTFGGDDDPKKGSRGGRSFVANQGNTVYIGVVHSATVAESARVMKALGMNNALNLDDGGSTALWSGGYKVGPGRNLPNVILFVKK